MTLYVVMCKSVGNIHIQDGRQQGPLPGYLLARLVAERDCDGCHRPEAATVDYSYRIILIRLGVVRRWQPRNVSAHFPVGADLPHPQQPMPVADSFNLSAHPPGEVINLPDSTHMLHSLVPLLLPGPVVAACSRSFAMRRAPAPTASAWRTSARSGRGPPPCS